LWSDFIAPSTGVIAYTGTLIGALTSSCWPVADGAGGPDRTTRAYTFSLSLAA